MSSRLRIKFQVQELLGPGEDPEQARYVTFGDDVELGRIKDFFERCGIATDLMFNGIRQAKVVGFTVTPNNKIEAIRHVRTLCQIGLKEAKDVVEKPLGHPAILCEDGRDADRVVERLFKAGFSVEARECSVADYPPVPTSGPGFANYTAQGSVPRYVKGV